MFAQRRTSGALAAAVLVLLGAGCATSVDGVARPDPQIADAQTTLDSGNYPTTPRPPLGTAGPAGHLVEARRMAEVLTQPFEVDPELVSSGGLGIGNGVIQNAAATSKAFPEPIPEGADHNFVAGFTAIRDNPGVQKKSLHNTLLRFATPEDADAAAEDMAARSREPIYFSSARYKKPTSPIGIPRHPETTAVTFEGVSNQGVIAFTTRGPFVLGQVTLSIDGREAAAQLVADTLDKQIPILDAFTLTPADQLVELPLDPDGLLARTLLPPEGARTVSMGSYGPRGFLTFSTAPDRDEKLFEETGVTAIASSGTTVYQARDAAGAEVLLTGFAEQARALIGLRDADRVEGLPEAVCLTGNRSVGETALYQYYCLATADRYLIEANAGQPDDAHQMLAAQYLMLTAE